MIRKDETNSFVEMSLYIPELYKENDGNVIVSREINLNGKNLYEKYKEIIENARVDLVLCGENLDKIKIPEINIGKDYDAIKEAHTIPSEEKVVREALDINQGKLTIGTASGYPPYEFVDAASGDQSVIGIDIELAQAIADKLGVKLEVQDMNFSSLLTSLSAGKVDMAIAGISPTDERKETYDFSDSYLFADQSIIINKSDADKYKSLDDFKGMFVGQIQNIHTRCVRGHIDGGVSAAYLLSL